MSVLEAPDAVDAAAVDAARKVLADAPVEGDTLALVSGGHDSLTAMYLAYQARRVDLDGIVHVNTGIGVPQTRAFVRDRAAELGLDYYEVGASRDAPGDPHEYRPEWREYTELILEYGFPGPPVHTKMYINLKHEPLKAWLDANYPDREVTLVSGVSRHESERRMENVAETGRQEYLGCTTISPLVEFRGIDVTRYRSGLGLRSNPVVEHLEMSGECLCLAPDTLIATERGWLPIQNVSTGDRIYSLQDGDTALTEVVETHLQAPAEMLRVKPYYRPAITVTPDHPLYARLTGYQYNEDYNYEKYTGTPSWVEAGEVATKERECKDARTIDKERYYLGTPFRTTEEPVDLTDAELRFLGYFISEGAYQWRPKRDSRSHGVVFCLSRESQALAENICNAFDNLPRFDDLEMRMEEKEDPRDGREYWFIRTGSSRVSAFVEDWVVGETSRELALVQPLMAATVDQQRTLLGAMWHGDGSEFSRDREDKVSPEHVSAYGTTSKRLALQVQELLLRQGEVYGINQSGNDSYLVRQSKGETRYGRLDGNVLWALVQDVERVGKHERHNLTVRGEPNYLTEAGLVHNCGSFADRGELRMLRLFYPRTYRRIRCLEARVSAAAWSEDGPDREFSRWGHGRLADRERDAMDDNEQALLCSDCGFQDECGEGEC